MGICQNSLPFFTAPGHGTSTEAHRISIKLDLNYYTCFQVQSFRYPLNFFMDADFESRLTSLEEFGSYVMYHGTTLEVAQQIKHYGFRCSAGGLLEPSVYVIRSVNKARCYPLRPRPRNRLAILKLKE